MPHVVELSKLFKGLELKLYRGNGAEVLGFLKRGDAELGLGADLGDEWERLDSWPLFTEDFQFVVNSMHRLANAGSVAIGDLKQERFVLRTYCESTPMVLDYLRAQDIDVERRHETGAETDLIALLEAGVGVALLTRSTKAPDSLLRLMVDKLELTRTIYLYGVAGRQRTAVASTLMKMLRAYDLVALRRRGVKRVSGRPGTHHTHVTLWLFAVSTRAEAKRPVERRPARSGNKEDRHESS
jgi:DNA-binding transcriptional LysR family regulator